VFVEALAAGRLTFIGSERRRWESQQSKMKKGKKSLINGADSL
jgi:hypothetical protein